MKRCILILAAVLLLVTGASRASEDAAPEISDIPLDEWRSLSMGRTLTYMIDGQFFALENYAPSGNRVMLQTYDGRCVSGTWSHEGTAYCYFWEANDPVCFRHVRAGGAILILHLQDGVETGEIQTMTNVSDAPLICDGLVS